jgi:voltage-gated potassium channel
MPIYHVRAAQLGELQVREWRRRLARTVGLLFANLVLCAIGLLLFDESDNPLREKAFTAVWNAVNLVSTLGDFSVLNNAQKAFVIGTVFSFLMITGYAISNLSGMLANHVVVIGFAPLGRGRPKRRALPARP